MPRYAWDDGSLADNGPSNPRGHSCDDGMATAATSATVATLGGHLGYRDLGSPRLTLPVAARTSGAAASEEAVGSCRACYHSSPPATPATPCRSPLLSDTDERHGLPASCSTDPPPLLAPSTTPLAVCQPMTGALLAAPPDGQCAQQAAASCFVASTAGLVMELKHGTNHLLAELEQRDSEVRVLRQALADLAREAGSLKPSMRNLLSPSRGQELDSRQHVQLQSIKRSLREKQSRNQERAPPLRRSTGTLSAPALEAVATELRSELEEALAKLAQGAAREKKLCEELDQLRKIAMHSHSRRRNAELDLERCKMAMEDGLTRPPQAGTGTAPTPVGTAADGASPGQRVISDGVQRSMSAMSMRSEGSGRSDFSSLIRGKPLAMSPPRTPPMPSRLSTCSSNGAPPTPSAEMRASSRDALFQAESLVGQMFELPGARSPKSGSRSPGCGRRSGLSRSPRSSSRACSTQTEPASRAIGTLEGCLPLWRPDTANSAGAASLPLLPLRSPGGEEATLPPPLPKARSSDSMMQSPATSATPTQRLRSMNGCMPRFPSAELGSPKHAVRAEARLQDGMRRRSCPHLRESPPPAAAAAAQCDAAGIVPTTLAGLPPSDSVVPAGSVAPSQLAVEPAGTESRPCDIPDFHLDLNDNSTEALRLRRRDVATPVSPALLRDDHIARVARTIAARMTGSPETPWPSRSPAASPAVDESSEEPECPKVASTKRLAAGKSKQQSKRFTPVELLANESNKQLAASRLKSASSHGFPVSHPGSAVSSPWVQCRNVDEIHRNWSTPMHCTIELS